MEELNELDSTCGVSDDELTRRFIEAVRIENEIRSIKGLPISGYDHDILSILMEKEYTTENR